MNKAYVRVYYRGLEGQTATQVIPHPDGLDAARGGEPFEVLVHPNRSMFVFSEERTGPQTTDTERLRIIPQRVRLPAGSLNELVRVYTADIYTDYEPLESISKMVGRDVNRGDMRGMYFQNPSEAGI